MKKILQGYNTPKWIIFSSCLLLIIILFIFWLFFGDADILDLNIIVPNHGIVWQGNVNVENVEKIWIKYQNYIVNCEINNILIKNLNDFEQACVGYYIQIINNLGTICKIDIFWMILSLLFFLVIFFIILKLFHIANFDFFIFTLPIIISGTTFIFSGLIPIFTNLIWIITTIKIISLFFALILSFLFVNKIINSFLIKQPYSSDIATNIVDDYQDIAKEKRKINNLIKLKKKKIK
ncbi:MAG: hypothetical protein LBD05_00730 [Mycoplasmataceae bacterium]|nr:hypothetical protein [Mycoplasmataceae bacterium]